MPTARLSLALLAAGFLAACGKGTPLTSGTATPSPTLPPQVTSQFKIPTDSSHPSGITLGIDGNIWFTETAVSKMGQLNTAGQISESVTPTRKAAPTGVASGAGPNLNVWFTEMALGRVAQITITGPPYTEFTLPDPAAKPNAITLGSDGNMWCTDTGTNSIWRIRQIKKRPFVLFKQFQLAGNAQPAAITTGPDGALWFTEPGTNSIGRLPVRGFPLSEFKVPTANSAPTGIAPSTDNALWFTEQKARQIGRIAVTGVVTAEYPLNGSQTPDALVQGIDGNFYFSDTAANKIGQFFFRSHRTFLFSVPTANSAPTALTLGPDMEVYFVESLGNKIGQFRYFNV